MPKNFTGNTTLQRLARAALLCAAVLQVTPAAAQDRGAELDRAIEEVQAADKALKEAEQLRDLGVEPQEGERVGTVDGGNRLSSEYEQRQARLAADVEYARKRLEAAQRRWGDLK